MGFFSFSRSPTPQRFKYRPWYYDPETEKYKQQREKHLRADNEDTDGEAMKARISGSFRRKNFSKNRLANRQARRSNLIVIITLIVLLVLTAYFIMEYLPTLLHMLE